MSEIEALLIVLEQFKSDKNIQAICLQSYINEFGPIPDEYGDKIQQLIGK